jgi:hypothetical protein
VVSDSVADAAGLEEGDHVVKAAGLAMRSPDYLVGVIGPQAPGIWLPLSVLCDG